MNLMYAYVLLVCLLGCLIGCGTRIAKVRPAAYIDGRYTCQAGYEVIADPSRARGGGKTSVYCVQ
jgi:hypothetical protein